MQIKVKGILSYPHLFTARAVNPGDDPKFSASILVRKDDPQVATVNAIIEQEKANGFPSGFPANGKCCWKDGAVAFPNDPAMHNFMILSGNAKSDGRPHVVDKTLNPIMDQSEVYAGAVVWASVNTFCYNQPVNKGIGGGLNGVMVTGEIGELGRLDGKPSVESMFGDTPVTAPPVAAPPVAPTAPAAPPSAPVYQMTDKANGATHEAMLAAGWSDAQLIEHGMMLPPNGVTPSFA